MADQASIEAREDVLHKGGTLPAMLWGLPIILSVALLVLAGEIWLNVQGWRGGLWAAATVGPLWGGARILVRHDHYGIAVLTAWVLTTGVTLDRGHWGGASCSPLPARIPARAKGMHHVG